MRPSWNGKKWTPVGRLVPAGPVNDLSAAFDDPQVRHREMVVALGTTKLVANPTSPAVTLSVNDPVVVLTPTVAQDVQANPGDPTETAERSVGRISASLSARFPIGALPRTPGLTAGAGRVKRHRRQPAHRRPPVDG